MDEGRAIAAARALQDASSCALHRASERQVLSPVEMPMQHTRGFRERRDFSRATACLHCFSCQLTEPIWNDLDSVRWLDWAGLGWAGVPLRAVL